MCSSQVQPPLSAHFLQTWPASVGQAVVHVSKVGPGFMHLAPPAFSLPQSSIHLLFFPLASRRATADAKQQFSGVPGGWWLNCASTPPLIASACCSSALQARRRRAWHSCSGRWRIQSASPANSALAPAARRRSAASSQVAAAALPVPQPALRQSGPIRPCSLLLMHRSGSAKVKERGCVLAGQEELMLLQVICVV